MEEQLSLSGDSYIIERDSWAIWAYSRCTLNNPFQTQGGHVKPPLLSSLCFSEKVGQLQL